MGGGESKATVLECMIKNLKTVLECMIKNLKKELGGDYGVKMKPKCLHILCEVEWPLWEQDGHQRTA